MSAHSESLILGWPIGSTALAGLTSDQPPLERARAQSLQRAILYSDDRHLLTFAPTGSGKGVSVIIPNLLHYSGPSIVIDPKGENFAVTAKYRKVKLRQEILLLDPFRAVDEKLLTQLRVQRGRLNPLDIAMVGDLQADVEAQMLAEIFAGPTMSDDQKFWDNSAKRLVSGIIAHEMEASSKNGVPASFSKIVSHLYADDPIYSLAVLLDTQTPSQFVSSSIGGGLLAIDAKETRAGILSTAQSYFSLFNSPKLLESLDVSTISLDNIQHRDDYTLYIVIPPNKLDSHSALLKAWVSVLMHTIMERKSKPLRRTLFILDECANLGTLTVLRKAVTLLRGYGLQVWMFFQDLDQLQSLYPDSATIVNNCGVLQAFGIGRSSAADPIARIVGTLRGRDLLNLDERQQALSVLPGKPQIARLARYYTDPAFEARFSDNPLIRKGRFRKHHSIPVRLS